MKNGHILVVDEADKAPTNVTCILKTLVESGEMHLSDGRRIVSGEMSSHFLRAFPFEKLVGGVSGAPKKNAAGWSENGSDITAGCSAKTSDITAGWCYNRTTPLLRGSQFFPYNPIL